MSRSGSSRVRRSFLASYDTSGTEKVRFLEKSRESAPRRRRFVERDEYFADRGRWGLGPDGRVYAAPERDHYAIHIYGPGGALERVIEREFTPWRRSAAEKARMGEGIVMIRRGTRMQVDSEIDDYEPSVTRLGVDDNGDLWVLHSRSGREQPGGVLLSYDLFDASGHFVRQVAVACEGNSQQDRLFFLGNDRFILVRGSWRQPVPCGGR